MLLLGVGVRRKLTNVGTRPYRMVSRDYRLNDPILPPSLRSWKRCLHRHGNGNGKLGQVGDADIEGAEAEELGTAPGIAVQGHGRPSTAQLYNLHLAPGQAMEASPQGLTDRLLGSKATGQACCPHCSPPAALLDLFF